MEVRRSGFEYGLLADIGGQFAFLLLITGQQIVYHLEQLGVRTLTV